MSKSEKPRSGAQRREAVLGLLAERAEAFRRQGYVVETWRTCGGRRLGPYYRLRYREGQIQRSLYLGRSAELAEEVRAQLRALQTPRNQRRQWDALMRRQRAEGRRLKTALATELENVGLRLKGHEIRGLRAAEFWRGSPSPAEDGRFARTDEALGHALDSVW